MEEFEFVVQHEARAIKWLPGAMGINPASPLCDRFYDAMVKQDIPILTHAGAEHAVDVPDDKKYENPLLFRRALEKGVRVIFAHCATLYHCLAGVWGGRMANGSARQIHWLNS